jgi:malate dehydrogenase (oxaloacetate-decarboxylating)(NADP+)
MAHNLPYAHDHAQLNFIDAIGAIKPHVLIGATGAPGTFTKEVIERMSIFNERPVVFALSNPTANAECTAEQAYTWSKGKIIFSSGSPFGKVIYEGQEFSPGQGNNAYVFPGIGLGAVTCSARIIPDDFFLVAAHTLAELVEEKEILKGSLYPPLTDIRKISLAIAENIAEKAYELGLARTNRPRDIRKSIRKYMYDP